MAADKPADQLRIYLNPGHGSWTSGDRPMDTLREVDGQLTVVHPGTDANNKYNKPDTTAFYESNTNIRKVLAMVDKLESYGLKIDRTKNQKNSNKYRVGAALDLSNNIVMSHVMAGPYPHDPDIKSICNRNLSEIREEVEVNNFDMFFSLHSNAASGSYTNYLSVLYRGYSNVNNAAGVTLGSGDAPNSPDLVPGSQKKAIICADQALKMAHQHWTERKTSAVGSGAVVGDIDFYHSSSITDNNGKGYRGYLGVLKHGVPGFLAEGYFHTYMPSKQRAMNWDADRMEGVEFARGIANIFGLEKEKTGDIFGVVRDKFNKFDHTYYKALASSTDAMLPLNGVTVVLYDENDNEVARYKTDNHYNGVYVFQNVQPGNYTITVEKDGYQMLKDEDYYIVVEPATTNYAETWMADNSYVQPESNYEDYVDPMADIHHVGAAGSY
ncbi:MAG: carboxypeptidase-like regulatory domain-containing protein, partial [Muribaculaceae bacterium]|nr:carboxypeptidase-like regulatory domain-containing protein [Muribaculaceae bacterium]